MRPSLFPLLFGVAFAQDSFEVFSLPESIPYVIPTDPSLPPLRERLSSSESCSLDVLFLYDTTGSMGDTIDSVQSFGGVLAQKIQERQYDSRFAVARFADFPTVNDPRDSPYDLLAPFSPEIPSVFLSVQGGGDVPEAQGYALRMASNEHWRADAQRCFFVY